MKKFTYIMLSGVVFFSFIFVTVLPVTAVSNVVKTKNSSTLYFLEGENVRHAFPNETTYKSWYQDYSQISIVSDDFLSKIPLGKNVTIKPGKNLVKVPSSPKVYAVEPGGILREITDAGIAENIYGSDWHKRVVDLSEVFFDNYVIGEPINKSYAIPDGVAYQVKGENKFYWKTNGILWPFASEAAMKLNGYTKGDVVVSTQVFPTRDRTVTDKHLAITLPGQRSNARTADCANTDLKLGFVLASRDNYTAKQLSTLEQIRSGFANYFAWASDNLSTVDTSYPVTPLKDDGSFTRTETDGTQNFNIAELSQTFFDTNEDRFDFLVVFTNFGVLTGKEQAFFLPVTNRVSGIGKSLLEAGSRYGTHGKLKGIIVMGNINDYELSNEHLTNRVMNLLTHEILHQWSGTLHFSQDGKIKSDLLDPKDLLHWNFYTDILSPLGGGGWEDNQNGTFTSLTSRLEDSLKKPMSQLDLYSMGLLPKQAIKPVHLIITSPLNAESDTAWAKPQEVTIQQIVEAEGKWACVL